MKTNFLSAALGSLFMTAVAVSAPLTETTAVHAKPDASSPAISYLKAGSEPTPASAASPDTPAGWMAVELPNAISGYVESKDLTKGLDLKAGAPVRLAPEVSSPVIATGERGDKTTITGIRGKWTQISLDRKPIGYINVASGVANPVPPAPAQPAAVAQAPVAPIAYGTAGPGQPAPTVNLADSSSSLPRQFAGIFVSTRSVFHPRRPYDWALNDNSGQRYAYADISKLLLTDQIEKYVGHWVVVFGAAKPTPDGKDIVIQVESLQLK
jgi:hypothetical protein